MYPSDDADLPDLTPSYRRLDRQSFRCAPARIPRRDAPTDDRPDQASGKLLGTDRGDDHSQETHGAVPQECRGERTMLQICTVE